MSNYYGLVNGLLYDTRQVCQAYTLQMNTLLGQGFQCRRGVWLSGKMDDMAYLFQKIDDQLCAAAKAASTMDFDVYGPASMRWKISQRVRSDRVVRLDYGTIDSVCQALIRIGQNMDAQIAACESAINTLNAAKYLKKTQPTPLKGSMPGLEEAKEVTFKSAQGAALNALRSARSAMSEAGVSWRGYTNRIRQIKEGFAAADKRVKTEIEVYDNVAKSKTYTKITYKNLDTVMVQRAKLKQLQKDYKAFHGVESPLLKSEITRLDKMLKLQLTSQTLLEEKFGADSLWQGSGKYLNRKGELKGQKGNCMACAYAVGRYLVTGKVIQPTEYAKSNAEPCLWGKGGYLEGAYNATSSSAAVAKAAYKNLEDGLPTMIHYESYNASDGHWVTVIGVKPGVDKNKLTLADLIVYNPGDGKCGPINVNAAGFQVKAYKRFRAEK